MCWHDSVGCAFLLDSWIDNDERPRNLEGGDNMDNEKITAIAEPMLRDGDPMKRQSIVLFGLRFTGGRFPGWYNVLSLCSIIAMLIGAIAAFAAYRWGTLMLGVGAMTFLSLSFAHDGEAGEDDSDSTVD